MAPVPPSIEHTAQDPAVRATRRALLRRERLAARAALPVTERAIRSRAIDTVLRTLLDTLPVAGVPRRLGFCWPHQGEFDARAQVERLLAKGWTACLPVVIAEATPLAFRPWTPQTALAADRYGIPAPTDGDFVTPDVLLIPLVAFDARNFRLGYGGGFFDRTLAALTASGRRVTAIGVGFDLARVADTLPGPHDIPLDFIVTEQGCCKAAHLG